MKTKIYFWAQHITNILPGVIEDASETPFPIRDELKERDVVSIISDVSGRDKIVGKNLVKFPIFHHEDKVVIDVDTADVDATGRKSNITCYVDNVYELTLQDWMSIKEKLKSYAVTYERLITEESLDEFERCFLVIEELQKKRVMFRMFQSASLILAALLLAALLWRLLSQN